MYLVSHDAAGIAGPRQAPRALVAAGAPWTRVFTPWDAPWTPVERAPDFRVYRTAVTELTAQVRQGAEADNGQSAEDILARRLTGRPFATVLSATPMGHNATVAQLLADIRSYQQNRRGPGSLARLIRITLLNQIDTVWWGRCPAYETDADVIDSSELVDLDQLRLAGQLRFSYRSQPVTLLTRAARSAERHTRPGRTPRTAGLWAARGRPQMVAWLDQLAVEFAEIAPPGTPRLWVNSLARSVEHQEHLRSLGYLAPLPSSHCVGYAADIEMAWYRRFRAHRVLRALLLDRQQAGEVNVIDEGQAWHVCLSPQVVAGSRRLPQGSWGRPGQLAPRALSR